MIETTDFTLAILLMAVITFTVRYVFFTTSFQVQLPEGIKTLLTFTAPCILTAMLVPIMFQDGLSGADADVNGHAIASPSMNFDLLGSLSLLANSPYFWASVFAIVCSLFVRQTLLVIVLSTAVFFGLRLFVFG